MQTHIKEPYKVFRNTENVLNTSGGRFNTNFMKVFVFCGRRISILTTALLCIFSGLNAQSYNTVASLSGRAAKLYAEVRVAVDEERLNDAMKLANQLVRMDTSLIDGWLLLGGIYHDNGMFRESEAAYEKVLSMDAAYNQAAIYQLAVTELRLEKFDESAAHFRQFLAIPGGRAVLREKAAAYLLNCEFAAEAVKNPLPFAPYPLSDSINTRAPEYLPVLTVDGKYLIYTSWHAGSEDFYYSQRNEDGSWSKGQPLVGVNTALNEGAHTVAADGRQIIFTACGRRDALGSCDLYQSYQQGDRWTTAVNLGAVINSTAWDSQPSLSADGRQLFFASERSGGKGGRDLWVAHLESSSRWARVENLGDSINTPGNEQAPFIHPDGQTLYFMSDGHPGMGRSDLFISRRNKQGQWSRPVNLGYPINTPNNEGGLFIDLSGQTAYFSFDAGQQAQGKQTDIYAFNIPEQLRPLACTYVRGKVTTLDDKPIAAATVAIFSDGNLQPTYQIRTNEQGEFLLVMPGGQDYAFNVSAPAYLFYSDRFELSGEHSFDQPFSLHIKLQGLEGSIKTQTPGQAVVLKNVLFETGSSTLLPTALAEIRQLANLLQQNPALRIQINGHTDDVGAADSNLQLSEQRAKAVYEQLLAYGIDASRLRYKGYGENRPLIANDSQASRAVNRRTEFELLTD